ncbi:MAG: DNA mismatch repair endonuclease MutL [Candidatus Margulisbacteria bacterium]|nr:DNA mismatch repair endonuclease MutL [Candidatus Margulisiibacteriota bacterium]
MSAPPSIKILPDDLVNKIAAGEVVERPAAVVKELVENSIDAKATKICIEIQGAGSKLIRVADNGQGMSQEDLRLSVQRHATSKISTLEDLFNIHTLGFRGEALPSIASVSKLTIEQNPSGQGITVTAKDLFYNTPARKKFLKSPATEMGHIGDVVAKYALAFPQIAFELIGDGKPMLQSSGSGNLKDAVLSVYGTELLKELITVSFESGPIKIHGLISRPTVSRIDKNYETFFVNNRYVKNFLLNRALEDAYRTLIPNNRYPAAILFIDIDPKQVDVNVHPTKREIKFAKTQAVMDAVRSAASQALEKISPANPNPAYSKWDPPCQKWEGDNWAPSMAEVLFPSEFSASGSQPLLPISTYKNTYIITTDGEDLVLIDQHAAHERIIYDKLSGDRGQGMNRNGSYQGSGHEPKWFIPGVSRQVLLIPENIELDAKSFSIAKENLELLNRLGFEIEEFGSNSFLLRAVPAISAKIAAKQLLQDIIAELETLGKSARVETKQENIRKLIACHSAVKAGDKLSPLEINQLVKDLYATQNPLTCPHGRPIMFRLTEEEIKKKFAR